MSLLPLLVLCIVGFDLLPTKDVEGMDEFRAAVQHFCAVSQHTFSAQFKDDLTFKGTLRIKPGAIVPSAKGLCNLVEGRPWAATLDSEGNHSRAQARRVFSTLFPHRTIVFANMAMSQIWVNLFCFC